MKYDYNYTHIVIFTTKILFKLVECINFDGLLLALHLKFGSITSHTLQVGTCFERSVGEQIERKRGGGLRIFLSRNRIIYANKKN